MAKKIQVALKITVELDPDDWRLAFGQDLTVAEIREEVREYIGGEAKAGVFADGEVPAKFTVR